MKTNDDIMKQQRRRFLQAGGAAQALQIAQRLVRDAAFDPVVAGGLARAKDFAAGTAIFGRALTAAEVRQVLGIKS